MDYTCKACGMECAGFRCDVCGETASEHDATHMHDDKNTCECVCSGCQTVESKCSCQPK